MLILPPHCIGGKNTIPTRLEQQLIPVVQCTRYIQKKEYRNQISKEKRKLAKRECIKNKRQNEADKQLYEFVKQQHIEASKELSYISELSDSAYRKWNSSAYHRNSKGNLIIDRKLKVGLDVPKSINMNIKIPTQKYKKLPTRNKYFYQSKQTN